MITTDQTKLCVALMDYLYPEKPNGSMYLYVVPFGWVTMHFPNQPINYN